MNILTLITTLAFAILTTALQPCAPRYAQRCNGINEIVSSTSTIYPHLPQSRLLTHSQEVCEQLFTGLYWVHGAWCVTGHICVDPRGDPQCVPAFNYCRPFYPKGEVEKIMEEVEASREQSQTQSQSLEIEAGEAADAVGEESGEVAGADEAGVADSAVAITAMNADTTDGAEDDATADSITNVDTTDAIAPSTLATVAAPTSEKRSDQSCYRLGEQRCYGWAEIVSHAHSFSPLTLPITNQQTASLHRRERRAVLAPRRGVRRPVRVCEGADGRAALRAVSRGLLAVVFAGREGRCAGREE